VALRWIERTLEIAQSGYVLAPVALDFVFGPCGKQYGVRVEQKLDLLWRFARNTQNEEASTTLGEHVALAKAVLSVPVGLSGAVAEFGCFRGMSTASLSLVCKLVNRRLIVFDSFEGLPEVRERVFDFKGNEVRYATGAFAGSLEQVQHNVERLGDLSVCEFVRGFFSETLPSRPPEEKYVLIFEDADLPSSVRDVLKLAWPRLQDGCNFFSQEARDRDVIEIFFDHPWWMSTLRERAPGIVGSGIGLPLTRTGSGLAYAVRTPSTRE
jgi:macrocin-O-methyltransferase TylF-like protien